MNAKEESRMTLMEHLTELRRPRCRLAYRYCRRCRGLLDRVSVDS